MTGQRRRDLLTMDERIEAMGLNEAIEDSMFSDDSGNKPYIRDFLERYDGNRPFLGLAVEQLYSGQGDYLIRDGVDYDKFDKMMVDLRTQYAEEDKQKKEQEEPLNSGNKVTFGISQDDVYRFGGNPSTLASAFLASIGDTRASANTWF